jgi:alpha-amylase
MQSGYSLARNGLVKLIIQPATPTICISKFLPIFSQGMLTGVRMFSDIDHRNPEVRADIFNWVQWLSTQLTLGGLRLDALGHFSGKFLRDLLFHIDKSVDSNWFIVGEYWRDNSEVLARYIEYMGGRISLFDVRLLMNFSKLSLEENSDLCTVFKDSLASLKPQNAVVSLTHSD